MKIVQHRKEIGHRLAHVFVGQIIILFVLFEFGDEVLSLLISPVVKEGQIRQQRDPIEVRDSLVTVCSIISFLLIQPRILRQFYQRVRPGRTEKEQYSRKQRRRRSIFFIVVSRVVGSKRLFPWVQNQLDSFSKQSMSDNGDVGLRVSSYRSQRVSSTIRLITCRQLPVLLQQRVEVKVIQRDRESSRINRRRQNIIGSVILGTRRTPPDVISQLIVASGRVLASEIQLFMLCRKRGRKKSRDRIEREEQRKKI